MFNLKNVLFSFSGVLCAAKNVDWNSLRWSSTDHDLNLKFGVTVPNNFKNGLNGLVENNPNLNDEDFYNNYYEDYFSVF